MWGAPYPTGFFHTSYLFSITSYLIFPFPTDFTFFLTVLKSRRGYDIIFVENQVKFVIFRNYSVRNSSIYMNTK